MAKKVNSNNFREKIYTVLRSFEENGGDDVVKIIKACIPTY